MLSSRSELSSQIHAALAERCATLGLSLWRLGPSGQIVEEPGHPQVLLPLFHAPAFRVGIEQTVQRILESCGTAPSEMFPHVWLLPLIDRSVARVFGMSAAVLFCIGCDDSPAFQALCSEAGCNPQQIRECLLPHQRRGQVDALQLHQVLLWMFHDITGFSRAAQTIQQFTDKLSQAYEETTFLFRMARLLNDVDNVATQVQLICKQLQQVLPFQWLVVRFAADRGTPDLAGDVLVQGNLPLPRPRLIDLTQPLFDRALGDDWPRLLHPAKDPLAAAVGAEVLAEPITHDGQVVGLMLAGNKCGPDADLSSFEIQFLSATAEFLGIFHENAARFSEQRELFLGTLRAMTAAIDAKDRYTRGHSERVGLLAAQMAVAMKLDHSQMELYRIAGLVHDVGKIGVPESVLCKPGKLTHDEFEQVRRHPAIGHRILEGIPGLTPVLPGVLHHHEQWSGHGYPAGLKGQEIPLIARVLALADAFDAMSSSRAYRPARPRAKVLGAIRYASGRQFDPTLVPLLTGLDFSEFDQALQAHRLLDQQAA